MSHLLFAPVLNPLINRWYQTVLRHDYDPESKELTVYFCQDNRDEMLTHLGVDARLPALFPKCMTCLDLIGITRELSGVLRGQAKRLVEGLFIRMARNIERHNKGFQLDADQTGRLLGYGLEHQTPDERDAGVHVTVRTAVARYVSVGCCGL